MLRNRQNELIYETETDLQISKINLWVIFYDYQRGDMWERDKPGVWEEHTHTTIYMTDKQGPTHSIGHGTLTQHSVTTYMKKKSEKE